MDKTALSFLKALVATSTPSGSETAGQAIVADYMRRYADSVRTDVHGNVHAVVNGDAKLRVMLAGHCDEIGLMVQHIDDNGLIYVSALGGVNVLLLQGERCLLRGRGGPVPGVVGVKPIHMMSEKERETGVSKIHELWIDIGARNRKDAEKALEPGDVGTVNAGWLELRNGLVACRAFDDRIGAFVIADVLRLIHGRRLKVAVHAVSTVQEEVGLRGARTAAHAVDPHIGIAVDVGFATDFPGMDEKRTGRAKLGQGPILHPGPTYHPKVLDRLKAAARRDRIRFQIQADTRGMSTDAFAMMMTRSGVAAGLISVPCRYMHSPVETIALRDAEDSTRLIARFLRELTGREFPAGRGE
jgi:endoglucanase